MDVGNLWTLRNAHICGSTQLVADIVLRSGGKVSALPVIKINMKIRYRVRRRSDHSKYFVVVKCMVTPSNQESGGHYSEREFASGPLAYAEACALCERLNAEQEARDAEEAKSGGPE
jgi:hypothetical protein